MIHPNCNYLDIYPYTWRNLGEFMDYLIPRKKILYILHKNGSILKAAASDNTVYQLEMDTYEANAFSPVPLFERYPDVDEIHILEESALFHYYARAQTVSLDEKNTVEYLDFITDLYRCHKGIDWFSRTPCDSTFYKKCLDYAQKNLQDPQLILFVVTKESFIWFDVILFVKDGIISEIRTLETLQDKTLYNNKLVSLQDIKINLSAKFRLPANAIHYTFEDLPALTKFWEAYHF